MSERASELSAALERIDALTREIELLEARLRAAAPPSRRLPARPLHALRLTVGETVHAMDTAPIEEIIRVAKLARICSEDGALLGILDLHGSAVPVVDVRARFGWGRTPWNANTPIVVTRVRDRRVGLLVDRVSHLVEIDPSHHRSLDGFARADVAIVGLAEVEGTILPVIDPELVITPSLETEIEEFGFRSDAPTEAIAR